MKSPKLNLQFLVLLTAFVICVASCKKAEGPGGQASVSGKVYAYDYDNSFNYLISKGYSVGTKVYIVYGNGNDIGNKMETSVGGTFEFKYLNKGHYKVYANSVDTAYKVKGNDTENPIIKEFDITGTKQKIVLEDIIINK